MSKKAPHLTLLLAFVFGLASWLAAPAAHAANESGDAMVVVELFTSQGCSSCPPADRLLSRLSESDTWQGRVFPLAFHVDYWNYIGWTDPFSSKAWSQRQERYAVGAFGTNRIYTPQMVLAGHVDCTGSDESCISRALRRLLKEEPAWAVDLSATPVGEGQLQVRIDARPNGGAEGAEPEVYVALYENGLVTPVGRGENAHRTLKNDHVVRTLARSPSLKAVQTRPLVLDIEDGWQRGNLGLVAFLQDPSSLRIVGAARLTPEALARSLGIASQ